MTSAANSGRTSGGPAVLALTAAAVCGDLFTPASFEPGLLYLPAVVLASWRFGLIAGFVPAVAGSLVRLCGQPDLPLVAAGWTSCTWFATYFLLSLLAVLFRRAVVRERRTARTDRLTGLANRDALLERIAAELNRSQRSAAPLSIAYIDCDKFKEINDRHGHAGGDRVLIAAADAMQRGTRNYDLVARPGGDEFVIVFPDTTSDALRGVIARLQSSLAERMQEGGWEMTFSIGATTCAAAPASAAEALARADELMYEAKRSGKDGVRFGVIGADCVAESRVSAENVDPKP